MALRACIAYKEAVIKNPTLVNDTWDFNVNPGDFILVAGNAWWDKLISFGQSLRFHGTDRQYAKYNHAALIVSEKGDLIEADGQGVIRSTLLNYKNTDHVVVKIMASDQDRAEMIAFASVCLDQRYGWTTIVSIGLSLLTGLKFSFGFDGQEICSGLVARALERTSAIFPRETSHITPADLAQYYL